MSLRVFVSSEGGKNAININLANLATLHSSVCNYRQLRQNYQNHNFQARVGKELPKQFPEPLSVGKLDVGNLTFSNTANTLKPEIT